MILEKVHIPDEDLLHCYIHHSQVTYDEFGRPQPKEQALHNTPEVGDNKSCEWSRFHTPNDTRELRGREHNHKKDGFKNPNAYFVYSHAARQWRHLHTGKEKWPEQNVQHDPIHSDLESVGEPNNLAHSVIIGNKSDVRLRTHMARKAQWGISPPNSKAAMKSYREEHGL